MSAGRIRLTQPRHDLVGTVVAPTVDASAGLLDFTAGELVATEFRGVDWDASSLGTTGGLRVVPEPATLLLLALGGLALLRRRKG